MTAPLPPHRHPRHAWAPMTDAEWALIAPQVLRPGPGRPPADPRRTWDAIFWIACSSGAWRHLPDHLGRADTAHRALRRALRAGILDGLLLRISRHRLGRRAFAPLGWRIARAWRRVTRIMSLRRLLVAKQLGLLDALPCPPCFLPKPLLSELIRAYFRIFVESDALRPAFHGALKVLHRLWAGDRRVWRTTD